MVMHGVGQQGTRKLNRLEQKFESALEFTKLLQVRSLA